MTDWRETRKKGIKRLILQPMREMARLMMPMILLIAGSQAAYPQNSFPFNLQPSTEYWVDMADFPTDGGANTLSKWSKIHSESLSNEHAQDLSSVLLLTNQLAELLPKAEKQFFLKYGYLAMYLSAMNPSGEGVFDRAGYWMLTFPDAKRYGLIVNEFVDERRDFVKSTKAAKLLFEELKKLHGGNAESAFVFGGAGWKRQSTTAIEKAEEDLTALRLIMKTNDDEKGLVTKYTAWQRQVFPEPVDVGLLLVDLAISEAIFRKVNPTIVGSKVPAQIAVSLPKIVDGHMLAAESKLFEVVRKRKLDSIMVRIKNDIPSPQSHQVVTYRVKSGDVLGRIAEHYGVGVSKIKKWNNLRSDRIDINQKLTIYYPKGKKVPKKKVAKKVAKKEPEVKLIGEEVHQFTIYEVQQGDTLWAISKKFVGVKPEDIMKWNAIGENLSIGQKLKIKMLN